MSFNLFERYFMSELRVKNLDYIIESTSLESFDKIKIEQDQCKVQDIILNHVDESYISRIINAKDPKQLFNELKKLKREESGATGVDSLGIIKVNAQIRVESIATTVKLQQTILLCTALIQGNKAENEMYSLIKEDTEERGRDTTST